MKQAKRTMSILLGVCLLLASMIIPFPSSAASPGYLATIDFEDSTAGSTAVGWNSAAMKGENVTSGSPTVLGTKVGKLTGSSDFTNAYYNTTYSVTAGKTYEVTAWMNHLSYQKLVNETYIGGSVGVFSSNSFSGTYSISDAATQIIYNADGTVAKASASTTSGKSYITLSTKPGDLATGTWYKVVMNFTASKSSDTVYVVVRTLDGTNEILYDNITLREIVAANVTVNCKESARVSAVGVLTPNVGDAYKFRVESGDPNPVVTVNGQTVTPDTQGIYSASAEAQTVIKVVCAGDENRPEMGKDMDGNDLTKYNQDVYLKPVWEGDTVYHEAALNYVGRSSIKLMYPIDKIVSLRSYDLKTYFIEGVDYSIENGQIKVLPGSKIPVYNKSLTTTVAYTDGTPNMAVNAAGTEWIRFIDDKEFPRTAIAVTYRHSTEWPSEYTAKKPASVRSQIPNFINKLESGGEVNIVIFGDSTACGFSSSGLNYPNSIYDDSNTEGNFKTNYVINVAPFAPTWIDMFKAGLQKKYPNATINIKNIALGGKTSDWGVSNLQARLALCPKTPDLLMIGFGGNDLLSDISPATYKANTESMIKTARNASIKNGNPNVEILLLAPKLNNPKVIKYNVGTTLQMEQSLVDLSNTYSHVATAKATSLFNNVLKSKEAVDYLNTNVNHGNDFFARVYTQMLMAILSNDATSDAIFNSQGGSAVATQTVATGSSVLAPSDPTKANYTFDGWFTDASGGTKVTFPYTVTGDVIFYAHWTTSATSATLTFKSQGGSDVASQTVAIGAAVLAPADPTKAGYTFGGWFTAATGGTKITFPYTVTDNIILYAQWSTIPVAGNLLVNGDFETPTGFSQDSITNRLPSPYTITPAWADADYLKWFRASGGNAVIYSNIIVDPGDSSNHILRAMQTAVQGVTVDQSKTYHLTFTAKADYAFQKFAITFVNLATANTSPSYTALYNVLSATGTKTYQNNGTPVTETITPYDLAGKRIQLALETDKWVTYNITFTLEAPAASARCGIQFRADDYSGTAGDPATVPFYMDTVSLAEVVPPTTATVTFDAQGGSTTSSQTVTIGGTASAPTEPTKAGYTFGGWFTAVTGGTKVTFPYTVAGDVTLYAQWTALPAYTPGDVNNDENVDLMDVTNLSRYLAGWTGLVINQEALDINDDGEVDLIDVTYLSRNLAGWPGYPLS